VIREIPEPAWDEFLIARGIADVYLSIGYLRASSILDHGEAKLLVFDAPEGGVAFPLIVRTIPIDPTLSDVISPYGYGGPVGFGASPPWKLFQTAYERWCRANRIVSTFVRFHPLYRNQQHAAPSMHVEHLAGTVAWRIEAGRDLIAQMHQHHRRSVRQATGKGLRVVQREVDDEGLARFRSLYVATMRRVGADAYYFFSDAYWRALRDGLGRKLLLAEILDDQEGVLVAALLFLAPPWIHYHLGASTEEGRRLHASPLLFLEIAHTAQENRFNLFHLGGGVGGSADSLLRFKRQFDPGGLREQALGKEIHDAAAYAQLAGVTDDTSGYFPRYRAGRT
jgi:hypothetical protein